MTGRRHVLCVAGTGWGCPAMARTRAGDIRKMSPVRSICKAVSQQTATGDKMPCLLSPHPELGTSLGLHHPGLPILPSPARDADNFYNSLPILRILAGYTVCLLHNVPGRHRTYLPAGDSFPQDAGTGFLYLPVIPVWNMPGIVLGRQVYRLTWMDKIPSLTVEERTHAYWPAGQFHPHLPSPWS